MSNSAGSPNVPKNGQRGFQPADRCVNGTLKPPANRQGLGICEGCLERAREVENVAERRRSGEGSREVRNWREANPDGFTYRLPRSACSAPLPYRDFSRDAGGYLDCSARDCCDGSGHGSGEGVARTAGGQCCAHNFVSGKRRRRVMGGCYHHGRTPKDSREVLGSTLERRPDCATVAATTNSSGRQSKGV